MDPNNNIPPITTPQPVVTQSNPVIPVITPTPPPVVPPTTITPESKKSTKLIIIIASIVILLLLTAGIVFAISKGNTKKGTGVAPSILQNLATSDLTKYDKDTDTDGYPDFIETELGLNPSVSEYNLCKKDDCAGSNLTNSTAKKHNVLIILDASGSMSLGGTPNRMEIAKQAIRSYVSKASVNTQIGLMIYGHKGSNSPNDKPASCVSAETISSIGTVNSQTIDGQLSAVSPVGWTPMGFALKQATSAFAGKDGENNEIILLTDGEESCNSNPAGEALTLKSSAQNIKINVIGFAVDSKAQTQLNQISTSGGGTFATANDLNELDRKFNELYENGLKLYAELKCNTQNVDAFRICYNSSFNKVIDWITKRKMLLYDKKITQEEYNRLEDLSSVIYKQQKEITTSETQKVIDKY
ncbi:conserved hypothetical protein [Candidatus Roizmanbacteria bacterium]|nr:conserved hypothetical protein [Candidatus Roizmanbacteria bacterium]